VPCAKAEPVAKPAARMPAVSRKSVLCIMFS
jgi:hypothetical protein